MEPTQSAWLRQWSKIAWEGTGLKQSCQAASVADPDPGSVAFLTLDPGYGSGMGKKSRYRIRDEHPGTYFWDPDISIPYPQHCKPQSLGMYGIFETEIFFVLSSTSWISLWSICMTHITHCPSVINVSQDYNLEIVGNQIWWFWKLVQQTAPVQLIFPFTVNNWSRNVQVTFHNSHFLQTSCIKGTR
jgi:hypothetical protein